MKTLFSKLVNILTSKTMKALYWNAGAMVFAGFSDLVTQSFTAWNPDAILTVAVGLVFARLTKYLNSK